MKFLITKITKGDVFNNNFVERELLSMAEEPFSGSSKEILSERVLVLNQSYEPLIVCSPKKAITLLFLEKADVVEFYDDKFIRTIDKQYALPSIIKLNKYVKFPYRMIDISRKNVLRRDGNTCQYCFSKSNLTVDHILPKSRGGLDTWENLTTACVSCNNKKGNRTPKEANMKLQSAPSKPNYFVFMKSSLGKIEEKWQQFLYF